VTVSGVNPGPLSVTVNVFSATVTSIWGIPPPTSQASRALSISSRGTATGQNSGPCPICARSSFPVKYSSARLVSNVVRASVAELIAAPPSLPVSRLHEPLDPQPPVQRPA
jgi:hypothetical protein